MFALFFILNGDDNAISFNDDGSPDSRRTGGTKVCINAQVDRALPLDWYFQLIALFPDLPGELKSKRIAETFRSLPPATQFRIWHSLSRVKIHIVDPRRHYAWIRNIVRRSMKRPDALQLVDGIPMQGLPYPKMMGDYLREVVAERVLNDSAAMRLQSLAHILADPFGGEFDNSDVPWLRRREPEPVVTVDAFGNRRDVVRQAVQWSAKSSAVFHAAVDAALSAEDYAADVASCRFFVGERPLRRMAQHLTPVHAFDVGNRKQLDLLEQTRLSLLDDMVKGDRVCRLLLRLQKGFVEVESRESYYVQAADFAAGIASDIYASSEGLRGVVARFEHVTYNGARVSLADAEEETKLQNVIEVDY